MHVNFDFPIDKITHYKRFWDHFSLHLDFDCTCLLEAAISTEESKGGERRIFLFFSLNHFHLCRFWPKFTMDIFLPLLTAAATSVYGCFGFKFQPSIHQGNQLSLKSLTPEMSHSSFFHFCLKGYMSAWCTVPYTYMLAFSMKIRHHLLGEASSTALVVFVVVCLILHSLFIVQQP